MRTERKARPDVILLNALLRGSRNITRMRSDTIDTVTMLMGLIELAVKLDQTQPEITESFEIKDESGEYLEWRVTVKHWVESKADISIELIQWPSKSRTNITERKTLFYSAGPNISMKNVQTIHDALPILLKGLRSVISIDKVWGPLLTASGR